MTLFSDIHIKDHVLAVDLVLPWREVGPCDLEVHEAAVVVAKLMRCYGGPAVGTMGGTVSVEFCTGQDDEFATAVAALQGLVRSETAPNPKRRRPRK